MSELTVFEMLPTATSEIGDMVVVNVKVPQHDPHGKLMLPPGLFLVTKVRHFDWEFEQITHYPVKDYILVDTPYIPAKKN